jgi:uncharacterized membrane protein (UPF0127 family)
MNRVGRLIRPADGEVLLRRVRWCAGFICKFRGLMLAPPLDPDEGLLLVEGSASRASTAIHMLFMRYAIAAIWLDDAFTVVDKVIAHPWRLAYVPSRPARYTLEANTGLYDQVELGDVLAYESEEP